MATVVDNPHFASPFAWRKGGCPVVEQDSTKEIQDCAEANLRTERGQRLGIPDLGIRDQAMLQGGANLAEIRAQVEEHEPRVSIELERDVLRDAVDNVRVNMTTSGQDNG